MLNCRCFNSMKVRLKRKLAGFDGTYNDLFQFHEGPIKTSERARIDLMVKQFQFHEGPIKTQLFFLTSEQPNCVSIP